MRFVLVNPSACHIALACVPMHFRHDDAAHSLVAILITALDLLSEGATNSFASHRDPRISMHNVLLISLAVDMYLVGLHPEELLRSDLS